MDYTNQELRQAWANYVPPKPKSPPRVKRKSAAPYLLTALVALIVCAVVVVTALPDTDMRITVSAAYLEHNGERVRRDGRVFAGIPPDESAAFTRLIADYKEIPRALTRIASDLGRGVTSATAATALIRDREATAIAALATLSTLTDGELREVYTGYYLYAQYRLAQLSEAPCANSVWAAAKDLWVVRS